ncbi:hypothetical protein Z045_05680 [Rhodococcus pyridinivorans KG-16]|uniref:Uncharacterized protein n=1 Tax=Rhodococcus pyridinivorans KG-16 TaxID=1441730 RepID=A0A0V9UNU5_9NOCA|nr:hypothetical protein Z045_05680 [Rhodococcus pyridinivorans KG-16]
MHGSSVRRQRSDHFIYLTDTERFIFFTSIFVGVTHNSTYDNLECYLSKFGFSLFLGYSIFLEKLYPILTLRGVCSSNP